jgi:hypothetical protein
LRIEKRIEQKFLRNTNSSNLFIIKNKKYLKPLYPERKVYSLYFDTDDLTLFKDSQIKDYEKYKIRFRKYDNSNNLSKEIKFTEKSGKFKIVSPTTLNEFNEIENFFYKGNFLKPSLKVEYVRKYFEYKDNRMTVDSEIKFSDPVLKGKVYKLYDLVVHEIKILEKSGSKFFLSNPVFSAIKFSKYEEGIKKLYFS